MTESNKGSGVPARQAEKDDAANQKLIANARRIAKEQAEEAEAQMQTQQQYDDRNAEVLSRSRANRNQ